MGTRQLWRNIGARQLWIKSGMQTHDPLETQWLGHWVAGATGDPSATGLMQTADYSLLPCVACAAATRTARTLHKGGDDDCNNMSGGQP